MKRFFDNLVIGMFKGVIVAFIIAFVGFLFWLDKVRFVF